MPRYFFDTIKKTIVLFANEFKNIQVHRQASDGSYSQVIPVELIIANKAKFYKRLQKANESTNIVLPAISVWNDAMDYNIQLQRNNQFFSKVISRQDEDLMKILGTPSPFTFTFTVLAKTKYYSDMRQIMESIIPIYQPRVTRKIQLIPEFDLSLNIPIILDSVTPNFELETGDDPESIRSLECEFSFRVESWVFPPIEEQHIARTIKVSGFDITSDKSPTDIVNNDLISFSGVNKSVIESRTLTTKANGVYKLNVADIISTHGEFFNVRDDKGDVAFVFEYDNNECYGKDWLVPESLSLNKTGNIFIRTNHTNVLDELPESWKITFWTNPTRNHQIGQNVFRQYHDFNCKTFSGLRIERQREIDLCYVDEGDLWVYSPNSTASTMQKVFCQSDFYDFEEFRIGLVDFEFEEEKIIAGVRSLSGNEITVETGLEAVEGEYNFNIKENGTPIDTFMTTTLPTEIIFTKGKVSLAGNETSISDSYFIFWIGSNFDAVFRYDYIRGY
jgi:hypothetical protein